MLGQKKYAEAEPLLAEGLRGDEAAREDDPAAGPAPASPKPSTGSSSSPPPRTSRTTSRSGKPSGRSTRRRPRRRGRKSDPHRPPPREGLATRPSWLNAYDQAVLGDLAGHDRLGDQDEEAHEVAAGAAGLLQLGEVVPEGLPLGLVPAVVALEDGMTCWLGELTTAPRVRLLDLMPVSRSRTRPGVSRTTDVPSSVEPLVGRVERRHHDVQDRHPPRRPVPHPGGISTAGHSDSRSSSWSSVNSGARKTVQPCSRNASGPSARSGSSTASRSIFPGQLGVGADPLVVVLKFVADDRQGSVVVDAGLDQAAAPLVAELQCLLGLTSPLGQRRVRGDAARVVPVVERRAADGLAGAGLDRLGQVASGRSPGRCSSGAAGPPGDRPGHGTARRSPCSRRVRASPGSTGPAGRSSGRRAGPGSCRRGRPPPSSPRGASPARWPARPS